MTATTESATKSRFGILPGEREELVNDGMWGKALAVYLQEKLRERGWDVPLVCCEDWGWWVEVAGESYGRAVLFTRPRT